MTTEQERKMLEAAAKACGITLEREISGKKPSRLIEHESGEGRISVPWNPLTNPGDTAEMCAELEISTSYEFKQFVMCIGCCGAITRSQEDHDNSRLKAWMFAATLVAAKIGGYE